MVGNQEVLDIANGELYFLLLGRRCSCFMAVLRYESDCHFSQVQIYECRAASAQLLTF